MARTRARRERSETKRPEPASPPLHLLPALAALSGATALVYESLWLRAFGLVFGTTTDAVATVLAVFMGGLGLGSLLAARRPAASPLRTYARVEMAIAATAVVTLPLLEGLPAAYGALAGRVGLEGPAEVVGRVFAVAVVLLPPTVLLGATVPLVVEFLDRAGSGFERSLGRIYLCNTLGGAAGVFLGTFVLVPQLGVSASLVAAALVNLGIGLTAWRWSQDAPIASRTPPLPPPGGPVSVPGLFAVLAAVSGAFTFGIEVLWTRSYALVIGSSVYAFSLILLAVLLGLVAGTALYTRLRPSLMRPTPVLGGVFVWTGLAALVGAWAIGALPAASLALMRELPATFATLQVEGFALCVLTLLPVTTALGFTFPLLAHLLDRGACSAQEASGRLYLWNTAGAILGALATDFVLVGALGLQRSYLALAALPIAAGAWALAASGSRWVLRPAAAALAVAAVAGLGPWWRPWDPLVMTSGVYRYGLEWNTRPGFRLGDLAAQRRVLFYREGREGVVAVSERVGTSRRFLSVNGKTDAGSGAEDVLTQKFIAHVPLLLHPSPRRALVIGWGSGATAASAALYPLERLECVEIEPATWEAAPFFEALSGRVRSDPRFSIVFRDGRNHLLRSRAEWDVIVSEPSNPWISGVSNLFTREFYEAAQARLARRGLFGQWFHYYNMELADVKVELATFAAVFPYVSVWTVPPLTAEGEGTLTADLLLVGSREPQSLDWMRLQSVFRQTPVGDDLRSTNVVEDEIALVAAYAFDRIELLRLVEDRDLFPLGTPLNTDDHPWIEFRAPRRNALPPQEVRRLAQEIHRVLGELAAEPLPPLAGHPGLTAGGADAAALHVALAEHWARGGLRGRAQRALERAATLDPRGTRALELLGGMAIEAQDWARAEEAHRALLSRRPGDVNAELRLAAVLTRQGKWADAREALRRARTLDPKSPIDPALVAYLDAQAGGR